MAKRKAPIKKSVTADTAPPAPQEASRSPKLPGGPLALAADATISGMRDELDAAQASVAERLKDGTLILKLDPEQIDDAVGSDRQQELGTDDEFLALRSDIEARGQTQPIRVRPARADWRPDAAGRAHPEDGFLLQSGRRRLAVCRLLGRKVTAIVSSVSAGDERRADLVERFAENTIRANLTAFERYLSIGQIASEMPDATQAVIAELLKVQRPEVSIGRSVWDMRDDLLTYSEGAVRTMPMVKIRGLVSEVKEWVSAGRPDRSEQPKVPRSPAKSEAREYRPQGAVSAVTAQRKGEKMMLEFDAGAGEKELAEAFRLFLEDHFGN
ncbi:ParB N-terminal domain-containing protein [Tritonibacter mobilis]|uniref:ParB N-terminal domain-containing protein n=1 Tax=Tritonibacter mobilis TaxID=379347 RepID=UPI0009C1448C|nr:ParB N-terminal domain-containing protein [Tritonibacter mobilis]